MATYAIGDIQGCLAPLQQLLTKVRFNPDCDQLWLAGDLVSRGPESLETLRFLYRHRDNIRAVQGNHDLHLLALAYGRAPTRGDADLQEIVEASDGDHLLEWLQSLPLIHCERGYALVHAGIPPIWSLEQAQALAAEVGEALSAEASARSFFSHMYGDLPDIWSDDLSGPSRLRVITNYLTRMRLCTADGRLDLKTKRGPEAAHGDFQPWFSFSERKTRNDKIIFGHWAALEGKADAANVFALDTGCVWGGHLTALRLEDEHLECADCSMLMD
ncbi:symmetrical bis(5'-nucleosyl)-tetraphosphatase [Biformimicrobium ophioploci]|uniref:Bis(5'-nucleosyl)-tetraphosphatase, symmetrical n=1 Tax=Biformimicrobium ophioploci TaxID=3036711 RepID=A0ABQ6LUH9_9GAMM|nr:symmetrical bis(5'-nucleosyl)-tetraphosphatase [Microbulbifer sp. NKW57]GMG85730.1 symmetrical bis(5'-nucleosyl)-tetraphosphatase [Microbulbifer sp. NKW57]